MKVEPIVATNVLDICNRLNEIQSGPDTMVIMTGRLYEEIVKVGSALDEGYRYGDKTSANLIETYKLYSIYTLRVMKLKLVEGTAWVALVAFDYKEFSGKLENNLYVCDIEA